MGWASGSKLAERVWDLIRGFIPEKERTLVARQFIDEFEGMDCDTIEECVTLCADAERRTEWDDESLTLK